MNKKKSKEKSATVTSKTLVVLSVIKNSLLLTANTIIKSDRKLLIAVGFPPGTAWFPPILGVSQNFLTTRPTGT